MQVRGVREVRFLHRPPRRHAAVPGAHPGVLRGRRGHGRRHRRVRRHLHQGRAPRLPPRGERPAHHDQHPGHAARFDLHQAVHRGERGRQWQAGPGQRGMPRLRADASGIQKPQGQDGYLQPGGENRAGVPGRHRPLAHRSIQRGRRESERRRHAGHTAREHPAQPAKRREAYARAQRRRRSDDRERIRQPGEVRAGAGGRAARRGRRPGRCLAAIVQRERCAVLDRPHPVWQAGRVPRRLQRRHQQHPALRHERQAAGEPRGSARVLRRAAQAQGADRRPGDAGAPRRRRRPRCSLATREGPQGDGLQDHYLDFRALRPAPGLPGRARGLLLGLRPHSLRDQDRRGYVQGARRAGTRSEDPRHLLRLACDGHLLRELHGLEVTTWEIEGMENAMKSRSRRSFFQRALAGSVVTGATLSTLGAHMALANDGQGHDRDHDRRRGRRGDYGDLHPTPDQDGNTYLALPKDFEYVTFSKTGDAFGYGLLVPARHDGMALFDGPGRTIRLIRNHEVTALNAPFPVPGVPAGKKYDPKATGGCTTLDFDPHRKRLVRQFVSIAGTINNCSGGWSWRNTGWMTCEENTSGVNQGYDKPHGYTYFVPADANSAVTSVPLKGLGRFSHEAAVADKDGAIYLTEDSGNTSGFYRFIPNNPWNPLAGGSLEMLGIDGAPTATLISGQQLGVRLPVKWVPIPIPDPNLEGGEARVFT